MQSALNGCICTEESSRDGMGAPGRISRERSHNDMRRYYVLGAVRRL